MPGNREIGWAQREALKGKLPPRYRTPSRQMVIRECATALEEGVRILDIGGGRQPTIPLSSRPVDCTYVGMDAMASELHAAAAGAYTDVIEADACAFVPELESSFDLIVSFQTLEHVASLRDALENARRYLRQGGLFVAYFSARYACYAIANRMLPEPFSRRAAASLRLARDEEVFPAVYDDCHPAKVRQHLKQWSASYVSPLYLGATYFGRLGRLRWLYLAYEAWAVRHESLATHVLVSARR